MQNYYYNKYFYNKCGIPGEFHVNAVDGTHIQIIKSSIDEHLYLGRKLKHSINATVVSFNIFDFQLVFFLTNSLFKAFMSFFSRLYSGESKIDSSIILKFSSAWSFCWCTKFFSSTYTMDGYINSM